MQSRSQSSRQEGTSKPALASSRLLWPLRPRNTPRGTECRPRFDEWFKIAQQNDFLLIDEFDIIMHSLQIYRTLSKHQLQSLCTVAATQLPDQLLRYSVRQGRAVTEGGTRSPWFGDSMRRLLPDHWMSHIPDMSVVINVSDEPKVVIPYDTLKLSSQSPGFNWSNSEMSKSASSDEVSTSFLDLGRQDAWEAISLACGPTQSARRLWCGDTSSKQQLSLIRNLTESKDICLNCAVHREEGFFFAPNTLKLTYAPVPILSQARPSAFRDVLFPSPYHIEKARDEKSDSVEWSQKTAVLYWAGAATGGYATQSTWRQMHWQRMTLLASSETSDVQLLRKELSHGWTPYNSTISETAHLLSIRIADISPQCEASTCEAEKQAFGVGDVEVLDPHEEAHEQKFLLDLDGNSFSGRFHRLLRTNSVIFKQTVFQEWHDDRLFPWIHFVPVNTDFLDLPELTRYLATTEEGDLLAREIGRESRSWAERSLRPVDMQLVWFRILLELGRMLGDED